MRFNRLSLYKGECHLFAIGLSLAIALPYYPYLGVFLLALTILLFRVNRKLFLSFIIMLMLYQISNHVQSKQRFEINNQQGVITMTVKVIMVEPSKSRFLAKDDTKRLYVYIDDLNPHIQSGDTVIIEGVYRKPVPPSMPHEFDYDRYLKSRNITAVFYADSTSIQHQGFSMYRARETLDRHIDKHYHSTSATYIKAFVLADRSGLEKAFMEDVAALGVTHLFAVSGLHVSSMALGILKGLQLLKVKKTTAEMILCMFLLSYMGVTAFATSVVRASSMAVLIIINRRFSIGFTAVDVCSLLFIVLLIYQPLYYIQTGFVLSFLIAFTLLLSQPLIHGKVASTKAFTVSIIAFLVSLPIITGFHFSINVMTPLLNIIFIAYTTFLLLPLTYLVLLIPFLSIYHLFAIKTFETMVSICTQTISLSMRFFIEPGWQTVVYMILLLRVLIHWKGRRRLLHTTVFIFYCGCLWSYPYLKITENVYFFHVHGDSILIQDSFNRCNILIDTGKQDHHQRLVGGLKRLHVTHLDYVLISHMHSDHYGAFDDVSRQFKITKTISNVNQHHYEDEWIICGQLSFYIFPLEHPHHSENNRSMVVMLTIHEDTYLFTGDIEYPREQTLLKYDLQATILKVPHHGSHTSSSQTLIDAINPQHAIISAHRNNTFNHPSPHVIKRLKSNQIHVHRTDQEGTIHFQYFFSRRTKKTPFNT